MSKAERQIEVIARGVLVRDGLVLLCQNVKAGYFYLPGGHVEFGESATAAVIREFEEESGLRVLEGACILVTEGKFGKGKKEHHELNVVFHVKPSSPVELDGLESREKGIAFRWVDLASVVDLDVRPEAVKAWLVGGGMMPSDGCEWISAME